MGFSAFLSLQVAFYKMSLKYSQLKSELRKFLFSETRFLSEMSINHGSLYIPPHSMSKRVFVETWIHCLGQGMLLVESVHFCSRCPVRVDEAISWGLSRKSRMLSCPGARLADAATPPGSMEESLGVGWGVASH